MHLRILFYLTALVTLPALARAQQTNRVAHEQCATMERLQLRLAGNPQLKAKFEQERTAFTKAAKRGAYRLSARDSGANNKTVFSIPVVFHIVLPNPDIVTDAKIQAQLDLLNTDFSGTNGDSTRIPSYFKPLFGKSSIQFCLAQQAPSGEATSGIERIKTSQASFSENDGVKHSSSGGTNSWDTQKYYNVWICTLSNGILGYSTFPDDVTTAPEDQGVVIDFRSLPGGSLVNYNSGKTLTHETGHYFNLYHIWGDDNGACTGSDDVDDTPNQADQTKGCYTGIKTDACTPDGNGIMYQNYMDYSYDSCLVMFTTEQVSRMESAAVAYRSSVLNSNACIPTIVRNYDARLSSINEPSYRLCSSSFTPSVTIKNLGRQILSSLNISSKIDNGTITTYNWKGSLAYLATTTVSLNTINAPVGIHALTIYVSNPNNNTDENVTNDTISSTIQFYTPVTSVSESFEGNAFPPTGWDIVNPDNSVTWKRVTGIAKTGSASVKMDNFNYNSAGENDDLRLPNITLQNIDSAFLSFQLAAAVYTDANTGSNAWDTLQVLVSTDCGRTYTSIYKKFGKDLITRTTPTTTDFVPTATEWRKDSIDIVNYIGQPSVLFAIRNTSGYENNIYLDDINVRTVIVNPNLKKRGFLVTPNPTSGAITVQFYPQPNTLRALEIYTMAGQKLMEVNIANGQANNTYNLDISRYAAGIYMVRAVFTDSVVTSKILKY
jgi:Pregnancy-associated plasma protein-A/Secretion system C-terminal sorting domain